MMEAGMMRRFKRDPVAAREAIASVEQAIERQEAAGRAFMYALMGLHGATLVAVGTVGEAGLKVLGAAQPLMPLGWACMGLIFGMLLVGGALMYDVAVQHRQTAALLMQAKNGRLRRMRAREEQDTLLDLALAAPATLTQYPHLSLRSVVWGRAVLLEGSILMWLIVIITAFMEWFWAFAMYAVILGIAAWGRSRL
jgi:hypothetical protein